MSAFWVHVKIASHIVSYHISLVLLSISSFVYLDFPLHFSIFQSVCLNWLTVFDYTLIKLLFVDLLHKMFSLDVMWLKSDILFCVVEFGDFEMQFTCLFVLCRARES